MIVACIVLSLVPLFIFSVVEFDASESATRFAVIRINGEEVDKVDLDNTDHWVKMYHPAKGKYNIVEEKNGKIRVKEDNSPDQIAVKTGWISKVGQTSICLQHRLVIEIISKNGDFDSEYLIY